MTPQEPIRIFIGYDAREAVAYHVCCQSILARASRPVAIHPVALNVFQGVYESGRRDASNDFGYTRFLIPWLCDFRGHALWLDGDMILRRDVAELWDMRRHNVGAQVVKHDYRTKHPVKYLGAKNPDYPRKNWSSVVVWNCAFGGNRVLTPEYVAGKGGEHLHRFAWLADEKIGELPADWNHLTMEYDPSDSAKLLHFTVGTPCFPEYAEQEGADEWRAELKNALQPLPYV